ncbi:TPR end-of-group domain-containing protein [Mesoaciditoga lauensis]|uniref:TPR end-of-group domain-containing protein n=1 Tax=Mesoaciditoga lauensis TaxID=1495039 RepID=UPI00055D033D|nr:hypothetical protein [Mesoaciditoga lauensis]
MKKIIFVVIGVLLLSMLLTGCSPVEVAKNVKSSSSLDKASLEIIGDTLNSHNDSISFVAEEVAKNFSALNMEEQFIPSFNLSKLIDKMEEEGNSFLPTLALNELFSLKVSTGKNKYGDKILLFKLTPALYDFDTLNAERVFYLILKVFNNNFEDKFDYVSLIISPSETGALSSIEQNDNSNILKNFYFFSIPSKEIPLSLSEDGFHNNVFMIGTDWKVKHSFPLHSLGLFSVLNESSEKVGEESINWGWTFFQHHRFDSSLLSYYCGMKSFPILSNNFKALYLNDLAVLYHEGFADFQSYEGLILQAFKYKPTDNEILSYLYWNKAVIDIHNNDIDLAISDIKKCITLDKRQLKDVEESADFKVLKDNPKFQQMLQQFK